MQESPPADSAADTTDVPSKPEKEAKSRLHRPERRIYFRSAFAAASADLWSGTDRSFYAQLKSPHSPVAQR